jgi:phage terminase small subunit
VSPRPGKTQVKGTRMVTSYRRECSRARALEQHRQHMQRSEAEIEAAQPETAWCVDCKARRPISDFFKARGKANGTQSVCKVHMRERKRACRARAARNRAKVQER